MKKLLFLPISILLLAFFSCSNGSDEDFDYEDYEMTYSVNIDNAMDTTAIVVLTKDGSDSTMTFEVDGYGMEQINLEAGVYHVTATTITDSLFLDDHFELTEGYSFNLNLTKADYILERVTYIVSEDPESYVTSNSFTYKGKTYDEVDATVIKGQLLVPSSWDYNLEEDMPEEVTIYNDANSTIKTKLYRAETFVLYLELFELFNTMDMEGLE